jgi:glycerate-2-kinase
VDRSPTEPFYEPFPRSSGPPPKGPDPVHVLAFRGAVTGADAYRAVRSALRVEENVLRVGNRFVPADRYREIAFVAVGHAALSSALGICDALGDRVTQGLVVGPDPVPPEVPFKAMRTTDAWPGDVEAEPSAAAILELANGLGERDLLILAISPGALPWLATPPKGRTGTGWAAWLRQAHTAGATGAEVASLARLTGRGAVGGQLAIAASTATVVPLLIDRGDGAAGVGGGPTLLPNDLERIGGRALLERTGLWSTMPAAETALFAPHPGTPAKLGENVHRPVVVATPADALRGAADSVGERKYMPRLAALSLSDPPEAAAERFLQRVDAVVEENRVEMVDAGRKGIVAFAALTLGLPEGVDEQPAFERFLVAVRSHVRRRELTISLLRTKGASERGAPPGAVIGGAIVPGGSAGAARPLPMRSGITDVGLMAVALAPASTAG